MFRECKSSYVSLSSSILQPYMFLKTFTPCGDYVSDSVSSKLAFGWLTVVLYGRLASGPLIPTYMQ